jgi:hypothetical protein
MMSTSIRALIREEEKKNKSRDECQPNQFHSYVVLRFTNHRHHQ